MEHTQVSCSTRPLYSCCCFLQTRHSLSSEREEFHLKESKLEASLASTKKSNQELEVQHLLGINNQESIEHMFLSSL